MSDTKTPAVRFREMLTALQEAAVLPSANGFAEELKIPGDMMMAFAADRPELLVLAKPRALDAEQVGVLITLIGVLMKTNRALRAHITGTGELIGIIDEVLTNYPVSYLAALPQMAAQALGYCRFDDAGDC